MKEMNSIPKFFIADSSPKANDENVFKKPEKPPPRNSRARSVETQTSGVFSNINNVSRLSNAKDTSAASSVPTNANDVSTISSVSTVESLITAVTEPMEVDFNENDADEPEQIEIEETQRLQRKQINRFTRRVTKLPSGVDESNIIEYDGASKYSNGL